MKIFSRFLPLILLPSLALAVEQDATVDSKATEETKNLRGGRKLKNALEEEGKKKKGKKDKKKLDGEELAEMMAGGLPGLPPIGKKGGHKKAVMPMGGKEMGRPAAFGKPKKGKKNKKDKKDKKNKKAEEEEIEEPLDIESEPVLSYGGYGDDLALYGDDLMMYGDDLMLFGDDLYMDDLYMDDALYYDDYYTDDGGNKGPSMVSNSNEPLFNLNINQANTNNNGGGFGGGRKLQMSYGGNGNGAGPTMMANNDGPLFNLNINQENVNNNGAGFDTQSAAPADDAYYGDDYGYGDDDYGMYDDDGAFSMGDDTANGDDYLDLIEDAIDFLGA